MTTPRLSIILAEFGKPVPDVSQYRECWPEADIQVYSDADVPHLTELDGPRYGWRAKDYWTVRKAVESDADVAICFDADMRIVDMNAARTLPALALRFGLCMPLNPRYTQQRDFIDGADVEGCADEALWYGPSVNCSPIAIDLRRYETRMLVEEYLRETLRRPVRAPVVWWRAMCATGIAPLVLPPQWCLCERHIGIGGEIILHEGHEAVKRHYEGIKTR